MQHVGRQSYNTRMDCGTMTRHKLLVQAESIGSLNKSRCTCRTYLCDVRRL